MTKRTAHSEAYLAGDLQNLVKAVCDRTGSTAAPYSTDCTRRRRHPSFSPSRRIGVDAGRTAAQII